MLNNVTLANWITSPWTTPRISLTPVQELVMTGEVLVGIAALFALVIVIGILGEKLGWWRW